MGHDARANVMARVLGELGLTFPDANESLTYLGHWLQHWLFCDHFARRGFLEREWTPPGGSSPSRDSSTHSIVDKRGRIRNGSCTSWLTRMSTFVTRNRSDSTSLRPFAIQWVMIQRLRRSTDLSVSTGSAKTKQTYVSSRWLLPRGMYKDQLPIEIDREWVLAAMTNVAAFSDIRVIDAAPGITCATSSSAFESVCGSS